jgi:putative Holliday junction resolvase
MTRVLGLDYGTRRIGAALSDPLRSIASPLEVYQRGNRERDARHYRELVEEHEIGQIVIGLPLHTTGRVSEMARQARDWGAWLAEQTGLAVYFTDERYSSIEAEEILSEARVHWKKRKSLRDSLAAQRFLQGYLDAGCPTTEPAEVPLADEPEPETDSEASA